MSDRSAGAITIQDSFDYVCRFRRFAMRATTTWQSICTIGASQRTAIVEPRRPSRLTHFRGVLWPAGCNDSTELHDCRDFAHARGEQTPASASAMRCDFPKRHHLKSEAARKATSLGKVGRTHEFRPCFVQFTEAEYESGEPAHVQAWIAAQRSLMSTNSRILLPV